MLTLLLTIAVQAGEPPPAEPIILSADLAQQARSTKKTRLALMPLKSVGTAAGFAEGLTESLATSADNTGVFDVVSPRQVSSLLAYEKRKELTGSCNDEACYVQIARLVRADHLVGGSVAQVGDRIVMNVALIDAREGKALGRITRETKSAAELMSQIKSATIILLQPLLQAREGYLKVTVNVDGAGLVIDETRRSEAAGQLVALAAGPHVVRIDKDGFYSTSADVFVRPGRVTVEDVNLIPARATVEAYERKATWMRAGAWTTGALAVGSAVAAGIFYAQATDNKDFTDQFAASLAIERNALGGYNRYLDERQAFDTNQGLYIGFLVGAIVSGAVSTYLFLAGDPPGRYDEFEAIAD